MEKIQMLAHLLKAATSVDLVKTDEFEEYLQILDELSYREIVIMATLEKYESSNPIHEGENESQRTNKFWQSFQKEIEATLSITGEELTSILLRLVRTGCYETYAGVYMDYEGGKGKLSSMYYKIKALILKS